MKTKSYLLYIIKLLAGYRKKIIIITMLMLLACGINMSLPILQRKIIDDAIIPKNICLLLKLVMALIMISGIKSILLYLQSKMQVTFSSDFNKDLQERTMNRLIRIQKNVLDKEGILNIYKNVDFCVESMMLICSPNTFRLFIEAFKFIGTVIGLFYINWRLSLFCLLFVPVQGYITYYFGKKSEAYSEKNVNVHKALHKWEDNVLNNIIDIKLNNMYSTIMHEHKNILNEMCAILKTIEMFGLKEAQLGALFFDIIYYALFLISGYMIWDSTLTIGGYMVVISYFVYLLEPVMLFASFKMLFSKIVPIIDEYEKFLNIPVENNYGKVLEKRLKPNLKFNAVSFGYGKKLILKNMNFDILYGEKVAITGANGVGKSTIIDLILRFNVPCSGQITMNEEDISDFSLEAYREMFAVLTQSNNLFNDTIKNNLTLFGKNKLNNSILNLNLLKFGEKFADGLDTQVGSKSSMVSSGEKQKILLSRILLKDSSIVIMDEPTANYDVESKAYFKALINMIKKAVIIVTHDEEILKHVGKIFCIQEQGLIVYKNYCDYKKYNGGIYERPSI